MKIKSFRGLMSGVPNPGTSAGTIDLVPLATNTGSTGYRIIKFETMKANPGAGSDVEGVMKIYSIPQTGDIADAAVDLSDQTLLAVNYNKMGNVVTDNDDRTIIIDNMKFNQDIYITYVDVTGNQNSMNYYIELEQVQLSIDENTVATLKDIRNITGNV